MPISKARKALYPSNWNELSRAARERAGYRCECDGECGIGHAGRCPAVHDAPNPRTGSKVVLTAAHLDHDPTNDELSNLRAMCQQCHLAYDADEHRASAAETRARKADEESGQGRLF